MKTRILRFYAALVNYAPKQHYSNGFWGKLYPGMGTPGSGVSPKKHDVASGFLTQNRCWGRHPPPLFKRLEIANTTK